MPKSITVLDHLVVVNLNIHIWSARKKLTLADLGGAELPPEDIASLGSKRICNPDELKAFGTLKARAVTLLDRYGVRFLGGWAVPEAKVDAINVGLAAVQDEFSTTKEAFLQRYDQVIQGWIAKHPQWAGIIANSTVNEEYVRSRIDFRWQMFRVVSPEVGQGKSHDSFHADINNLGNRLFGEVAKTAEEAWKRCYAGKTEVTRKALSPLKSIHDKLVG